MNYNNDCSDSKEYKESLSVYLAVIHVVLRELWKVCALLAFVGQFCLFSSCCLRRE